MLNDAVVYVAGDKALAGNDIVELHAYAKKHNGFVWLDVVNPTPDEMEMYTEEFGLHPLAVEDMLHSSQRTKVEDYGDSEFVALKSLSYNDETSQVETSDLLLYISTHFVMTVQYVETSLLKVGSLARSHVPAGPYALFYQVLDSLVDSYSEIALELERDVNDIEIKVFSSERKSWSQELYFLKREVIEFRRAAEPLRTILPRFSSDQHLAIPAGIRPFFRDVDDHLNRAADTMESLDSLINSALNADLAQLQVSQNEDMRRITAWVALAAAPTMVAGIYGMNFDHMPAISSEWGFWVTMASLSAFSVWLYLRFKRANWL